MSKGNDTVKTIGVAAALCLVCSIIVSVTVVQLRPAQAKNALLDYKKNILMAAGMLEKGGDIEATFEKLETVIIDMETGKLTTDVDAATYDQVKAAKDPAMSVKIPANIDVGGLSTRPNFAKAFLEKDESGAIKTIILNLWGKGLWSTMYGFIALDADTTTVKGFAYYSQGETPGLGGEVDNPKWKQQWVGKNVYDDSWKVAFAVAKGAVDHSSNKHNVDGISGATITCNGVTSSMEYWFGDHAYGKFLSNVRAGEI